MAVCRNVWKWPRPTGKKLISFEGRNIIGWVGTKFTIAIRWICMYFKIVLYHWKFSSLVKASQLSKTLKPLWMNKTVALTSLCWKWDSLASPDFRITFSRSTRVDRYSIRTWTTVLGQRGESWPRWWSSGQRSGFLLWQSEFDSRWLLNFLVCTVRRKDKNKLKRDREWFIFKKRVES